MGAEGPQTNRGTAAAVKRDGSGGHGRRVPGGVAIPNDAEPVTDRTWNPWVGCTKVSAGCAHCYMFRQLREYDRDPAAVRRTKTWGTELVSTASWSDWFHEAADGGRDEAWAVVRRCPNLTFQVLTKRAERIAARRPADWGGGYSSVASTVSGGHSNDR